MKHFIGIDLGTTNSAICSFDGRDARVWKGPDQSDVTPSAIYIDKRGNRYYGKRAYDNAPRNPDSSATLFKRFMGTGMRVELKAAGVTLTPEELSAEILKVMYGYLPEEMRVSAETGVVITVPAAFNQMKKNATLDAAKLADFERVALMQEPVAAIMSVMRASRRDGMFLIYDLGGGTFDISVAESIGGKVNLLAHGGIEMCGGRDWDRMMFTHIVKPWLNERFKLPADFDRDRAYKTLVSLAQWASEKAKIALSAQEESVIALSENEARALDMDGAEIYIDIPVTRERVNKLISSMIDDTIAATRDTVKKAGIPMDSVQRIVFVGGPTCYKPLRDKVCAALGLPADTGVNPMTAVAEGASIYAESIDWSSVKHERKLPGARGDVSDDITFKYNARTSFDQAKLVFFTRAPGRFTAEAASKDTGWVSGRVRVEDMISITLPLANNGENAFELSVYDENGAKAPIKDNYIVVTKTIANLGAIPASHSIGVEVMSAPGSEAMLDFLVREGDDLPKRGVKRFKAGSSVRAGENAGFLFKLWEGNIESPAGDNRFIGVMRITGDDFDSGIVAAGAEIVCEYEMADSGAINLEVSIPSIGATFSNRNFYSRQEGQADALDAEKIARDAKALYYQLSVMRVNIHDDRIFAASAKVNNAMRLRARETDPETLQKAHNELLEAKKLIARIRLDNKADMRKLELERITNIYNERAREHARESERLAFDDQVQTARRAIERDSPDFDAILMQLDYKTSAVLQRQDWYIVKIYKIMASSDKLYVDKPKFEALKARGDKCLKEDDINALRMVVYELSAIQIKETAMDDIFEKSNILKG